MFLNNIFEQSSSFRYSEICERGYDFRTPHKSSMGTENFSQLVWKSSRYLGIGKVITKRNEMTCTIVVARYQPRGNIHGQFEKNVDEGDFDASVCQHVLRKASSSRMNDETVTKPDITEPEVNGNNIGQVNKVIHNDDAGVYNGNPDIVKRPTLPDDEKLKEEPGEPNIQSFVTDKVNGKHLLQDTDVQQSNMEKMKKQRKKKKGSSDFESPQNYDSEDDLTAISLNQEEYISRNKGSVNRINDTRFTNQNQEINTKVGDITENVAHLNDGKKDMSFEGIDDIVKHYGNVHDGGVSHGEKEESHPIDDEKAFHNDGLSKEAYQQNKNNRFRGSAFEAVDDQLVTQNAGKIESRINDHSREMSEFLHNTGEEEVKEMADMEQKEMSGKGHKLPEQNVPVIKEMEDADILDKEAEEMPGMGKNEGEKLPVLSQTGTKSKHFHDTKQTSDVSESVRPVGWIDSGTKDKQTMYTAANEEMETARKGTDENTVSEKMDNKLVELHPNQPTHANEGPKLSESADDKPMLDQSDIREDGQVQPVHKHNKDKGFMTILTDHGAYKINTDQSKILNLSGEIYNANKGENVDKVKKKEDHKIGYDEKLEDLKEQEKESHNRGNEEGNESHSNKFHMEETDRQITNDDSKEDEKIKKVKNFSHKQKEKVMEGTMEVASDVGQENKDDHDKENVDKQTHVNHTVKGETEKHPNQSKSPLDPGEGEAPRPAEKEEGAPRPTEKEEAAPEPVVHNEENPPASKEGENYETYNKMEEENVKLLSKTNKTQRGNDFQMQKLKEKPNEPNIATNENDHHSQKPPHDEKPSNKLPGKINEQLKPELKPKPTPEPAPEPTPEPKPSIEETPKPEKPKPLPQKPEFKPIKPDTEQQTLEKPKPLPIKGDDKPTELPAEPLPKPKPLPHRPEEEEDQGKPKPPEKIYQPVVPEKKPATEQHPITDEKPENQNKPGEPPQPSPEPVRPDKEENSQKPLHEPTIPHKKPAIDVSPQNPEESHKPEQETQKPLHEPTIPNKKPAIDVSPENPEGPQKPEHETQKPLHEPTIPNKKPAVDVSPENPEEPHKPEHDSQKPLHEPTTPHKKPAIDVSPENPEGPQKPEHDSQKPLHEPTIPNKKPAIDVSPENPEEPHKPEHETEEKPLHKPTSQALPMLSNGYNAHIGNLLKPTPESIDYIKPISGSNPTDKPSYFPQGKPISSSAESNIQSVQSIGPWPSFGFASFGSPVVLHLGATGFYEGNYFEL